MYAIGDFLTDSDGTTGIKSLEVHYDSLFVEVIGSDLGFFFSHLLIDKLVWDYDNVEYLNAKAGIILNIGETSVTNHTGSQLIGTKLLSKSKKVLIFALEEIVGSFILNVYEYDINLHTLKKIYPMSDIEISDWENSSLGELSETQKPLLYIDRDTIDILISSTTHINIYTFNPNQGLTASRKYTQDLDIPLTIKTFMRTPDNGFVCFYEDNAKMIPFELPSISP